jgi:hypothetical protein
MQDHIINCPVRHRKVSNPHMFRVNFRRRRFQLGTCREMGWSSSDTLCQTVFRPHLPSSRPCPVSITAAQSLSPYATATLQIQGNPNPASVTAMQPLSLDNRDLADSFKGSFFPFLPVLRVSALHCKGSLSVSNQRKFVFLHLVAFAFLRLPFPGLCSSKTAYFRWSYT